MKINLIVPIVLLLCSMESKVLASNDSPTTSLREAAIPQRALKQLEKLQNPENPEHAQLGNRDRCIYLTRPSSNNIIAALFVAPDGGRHWCLNPYPDFVDYGDIPTLKSMTTPQMEQLWGSDETHGQSKNSNRTFRLVAVNNWKDKDVFVDVLVQNDHIKKYRVRGWMITQNDYWCTLEDKKGEGRSPSPRNASSPQPVD